MTKNAKENEKHLADLTYKLENIKQNNSCLEKENNDLKAEMASQKGSIDKLNDKLKEHEIRIELQEKLSTMQPNQKISLMMSLKNLMVPNTSKLVEVI